MLMYTIRVDGCTEGIYKSKEQRDAAAEKVWERERQYRNPGYVQCLEEDISEEVLNNPSNKWYIHL